MRLSRQALLSPRAMVVVLLLGLIAAQSPRLHAADADAADKQAKPIRALLITGGCCHDYTKQKVILSKGVSARADVEWTIVQQGGSSTDAKIPVYEQDDWAKGYDVVVHNECFAAVKDPAWVQRVLKPHRDGTPAVLIHCAAHCYRVDGPMWFEFCGVRSHNHGPHYAFDVENQAKDHPIMAGFGESWRTPKGELYNIAEVYEGTKVLAAAKRRNDDQPQATIWVHEYGPNKTRVFGTTIGHYNETMAEPAYLDVVTRGLLWATGRLDDEGSFRKTDEKTDDEIRALAK